MASDIRRAIEAVWRIESARLIAGLARIVRDVGVAEDLDLVRRYRDAGVARVVFNLAPAKADEVLPVLDRAAALMRQARA